MFRITYKRQAAKYLQRIQAQKANRFYDAFDRIAEGKDKGLNITTFQGLDNGYRLRIGDHRAIYTKIEETLTIEIIKIGTRGDIYK
jgi:mRNA interferase RelE/StbE